MLYSNSKTKQLDLLKLSLGLAPKHLDGAGCGRGVATDDSKGGHTPSWIPRVNDIGDVFDDIVAQPPLPTARNHVIGDANDVEL